jgi:hypothetical protein
MKVDWPHVAILAIAAAFVAALCYFALRSPAFLPAAIAAAGAVTSLFALAWRGGQLAGRAADANPSSGPRDKNSV